LSPLIACGFFIEVEIFYINEGKKENFKGKDKKQNIEMLLQDTCFFEVLDKTRERVAQYWTSETCRSA